MIRRLIRTLTTDVDGLRARIAYLERENARLAEQRDRERAAAADAEMSAAIGESVIAALHGEPVSDFAESFGPVMEAQTLRLTLDLVRGDNEALWRVVRDACAYLHVTDDDEADWPKLPAYAKQAAEDADRLRALAGNTAATPAEARMLEIVRANPGMLAPDLGMLAHRNNCDRERAKAVAEHGEAYAESGWWNHPFSRGDYMPTEASRPLQTLHRKGLVRREKAGQTYRYWPTERA